MAIRLAQHDRFFFFIQAVTGILLWMYYSPERPTAWESVYYLQYQVLGGWLLRAIHHYAAQVMLVAAGDLAASIRRGGATVHPASSSSGPCAPGLLDAGAEPDRRPAPLGPERLLQHRVRPLPLLLPGVGAICSSWPSAGR